MTNTKKDPYTKKPSLSQIAALFLKIGATAFGGPAAHLAVMEEEMVRRRGWISREDYLDLVSAANLIPGPNSTEVAIHVGHKLAGWRGLILAGACFILPAFLIVWGLAWLYVHFGTLPAVQSVFLAIKPVILAVILQAVWSLSRSAVKDRTLAILGLLSLILFLLGQNEIFILFVVAFANLLLRQSFLGTGTSAGAFTTIALLKTEKAMAQLSTTSPVPLESLFVYFAKVGSVLFGSGYVLIAFLQKDLVENFGWISEQQLLDAIAVGQFTPGPVFTTATFIGYLVSGNSGAVIATLGIFTPAFFFVALSLPFISQLRKATWSSQMLDGLNVASLSLMLGAGLIMGSGTTMSLYGSIAFLLSAYLLIRYKINSAWLILGAAILSPLGFASF